jgi:hypothetical protein
MDPREVHADAQWIHLGDVADQVGPEAAIIAHGGRLGRSPDTDHLLALSHQTVDGPEKLAPPVLQHLSHVVPAKWFLVIIRGIMLKGVGLEYLWRETLVLLAMTAVLLTVNRQRRIEHGIRLVDLHRRATRG